MSSLSQSEAEIRSGECRDMGAVKKGVVPRNVTVVRKSTRVRYVVWDPMDRIISKNLGGTLMWAGFLPDTGPYSAFGF